MGPLEALLTTIVDALSDQVPAKERAALHDALAAWMLPPPEAPVVAPPATEPPVAVPVPPPTQEVPAP